MTKLVSVELLTRRGAINAGETAGYPEEVAKAMIRRGEARVPGERTEEEEAANPANEKGDTYSLPAKWHPETWRESTHNLALLHEANRVRPLQEGETSYTKERAIEIIEEALGVDEDPDGDGE